MFQPHFINGETGQCGGFKFTFQMFALPSFVYTQKYGDYHPLPKIFLRFRER